MVAGGEDRGALPGPAALATRCRRPAPTGASVPVAVRDIGVHVPRGDRAVGHGSRPALSRARRPCCRPWTGRRRRSARRGGCTRRGRRRPVGRRRARGRVCRTRGDRGPAATQQAGGIDGQPSAGNHEHGGGGQRHAALDPSYLRTAMHVATGSRRCRPVAVARGVVSASRSRRSRSSSCCSSGPPSRAHASCDDSGCRLLGLGWARAAGAWPAPSTPGSSPCRPSSRACGRCRPRTCPRSSAARSPPAAWSGSVRSACQRSSSKWVSSVPRSNTSSVGCSRPNLRQMLMLRLTMIRRT